MLTQPQILVCTDYSENSDMALRVAERLAQRTKGTVHLIHVAEVDFYFQDSDHSPEKKSRFYELIHVDLLTRMRLQKNRCKSTASCMVCFDTSAVKAINKTVKESNIDLVVIGNRGASNIWKFLMGSLTRKVVSSADVPVLVVKNENDIKRIAALVDDSEDMEKVIADARNLAQISSSSLDVVSLCSNFSGLYSTLAQEYSSAVIATANQQCEKGIIQIKKKIEGLLQGDNDVKVIAKISHESNLAGHLVEILEDENTDLAVMKRSRKSSLDKFVMGSVSGKVLEHFRGNVIIV